MVFKHKPIYKLGIINYNSSKFTTFRHSVVATPMDVMAKGKSVASKGTDAIIF